VGLLMVRPSRDLPTSTLPSVSLRATDLARGRLTTASSGRSANVVDGDTSTYWESGSSAFPQWAQVDLGSVTTVGRVTLVLPSGANWTARTQTLSLLGSTDGATFHPVVPSTGYSFEPSIGNSVSITFTPSGQRFIRVEITANTAWQAGQIGEMSVYSG
jgi:hypothetical protein